MRLLSLLLGTGTATAATLLLFACGGGDSPAINLMPEDLRQMVIQADDLGPGYKLNESHEGSDLYPPEQAIGAYEVRYGLKSGVPAQHGIEVVMADVYLLASSEDASELMDEMKEAPWEDPEFSEVFANVPVPDLGDETLGISMRLPAGTWFIDRAEEPVEAFTVLVRRGTLVWTVTAGGEGASSDEAMGATIELATTQQERVEAVLQKERSRE